VAEITIALTAWACTPTAECITTIDTIAVIMHPTASIKIIYRLGAGGYRTTATVPRTAIIAINREPYENYCNIGWKFGLRKAW
jgi:hypothetical protein